MNWTDLGLRARSRRRQLGLTQAQTAERAGLSPSYIAHLEHGTRFASLETFVALCNALALSPEILLRGSLAAPCRTMPEQGAALAERFTRIADGAMRQFLPRQAD